MQQEIAQTFGELPEQDRTSGQLKRLAGNRGRTELSDVLARLGASEPYPSAPA